jgi:hypothetical protein
MELGRAQGEAEDPAWRSLRDKQRAKRERTGPSAEAEQERRNADKVFDPTAVVRNANKTFPPSKSVAGRF